MKAVHSLKLIVKFGIFFGLLVQLGLGVNYAWEASDEPVILDYYQTEVADDIMIAPHQAVETQNNTVLITEWIMGVVQERDIETGDLIDVWGEELLAGPIGLAINSVGNIYVADYDDNKILKFSSNHELLQTWNSGFNRPWGVAVSEYADPDTGDDIYRVYVVSRDNNEIRIIERQENGDEILLSSVLNGVDFGVGAFNRPRGIAVTDSGEIYVGDTGNDRVVKIESDLSSASEFLSSADLGSGGDPRGVSVTPDGDILVAHGVTNRVVCEYSVDGSENFCLGDFGDSYGRFKTPNHGIELGTGDILTLDSFGSIISKFAMNGEGNYVFSDSWYGSPESLGRIMRMYLKDELLYIADSERNSIQLLNIATGEWSSLFGPDILSSYGISVDEDGGIYLSAQSDSIQKVNSAKERELLIGDGTSGSGDYQFSWPFDIDVGSDNKIWVL